MASIALFALKTKMRVIITLKWLMLECQCLNIFIHIQYVCVCTYIFFLRSCFYVVSCSMFDLFIAYPGVTDVFVLGASTAMSLVKE